MKNLTRMNKTQTGRSMVEMLGVLAIVGVLSIAGVTGYNSAMRSYRANEIVNSAGMLYAMGVGQKERIGAEGLDGVAALGSLPARTVAMTYQDKSVSITVADEDTCKDVREKIGTNPILTVGECSSVAGGYSLVLAYDSGSDKEGAEGGEEEKGEEDPPVNTCNGHGTYDGTKCTCSDNYYGDNCETAPLNCEHGGWDTTRHVCDCLRTGYDGDRCQNLVTPTASDIVVGNACPASIYRKTYCKNIQDGCESWECEETGTYPNYEYEWVWDTMLLRTSCEDAEYCDWIEGTANPCKNVTCQHGGVCSNGTCDCTGTGYTGTNCETCSGGWIGNNDECCTTASQSESCCKAKNSDYTYAGGRCCSHYWDVDANEATETCCTGATPNIWTCHECVLGADEPTDCGRCTSGTEGTTVCSQGRQYRCHNQIWEDNGSCGQSGHSGGSSN